jgi:hypothetical protein
MRNTFFFSQVRRRRLIPLVACAGLLFFASDRSALAQAVTEQPIVVSGEEVPSAYGPGAPSAYGAPPAFSQSRFAPLTNAYVLPPGGVYTSLIYEDDVVHFRSPDHHWTQELEIGLPYRFNVAIENDVQRYDGDLQDATFSFEARYAFADWDKIPLNPTIFAEYKMGIGDILHDEGAPTPAHKFGPDGFDKSQEIPDAYEVRLLLSEDFFEKVEWALNAFFEQETAGDRGREWGIAQSVVTPIHLFHAAPLPAPDDKNVRTKNVQPVAGTTAPWEELKVGIECQFRSFSDKFSRGTPYNSFVIGPTASWKPTRRTSLDVSPLFGVNHKSPIMQLFVVVSYYFGGGGPGAEAGGEAPASTRNR